MAAALDVAQMLVRLGSILWQMALALNPALSIPRPDLNTVPETPGHFGS